MSQQHPQPQRRLRVVQHHLRPNTVGDQNDTGEQKVVLVTGCSSGLGENLCREFIELGHMVI
jgi:hypothetical protein